VLCQVNTDMTWPSTFHCRVGTLDRALCSCLLVGAYRRWSAKTRVIWRKGNISEKKYAHIQPVTIWHATPNRLRWRKSSLWPLVPPYFSFSTHLLDKKRIQSSVGPTSWCTFQRTFWVSLARYTRGTIKRSTQNPIFQGFFQRILSNEPLCFWRNIRSSRWFKKLNPRRRVYVEIPSRVEIKCSQNPRR
jgi:hypothetical protein